MGYQHPKPSFREQRVMSDFGILDGLVSVVLIVTCAPFTNRFSSITCKSCELKFILY